jgi:serine/threonine protein kinase
MRELDAEYTQAGTMLGTPAYMPPEQAGGELDRIDERADVFGLGAILAVILTGQPPYVGKDSEAVRLQAVRGQLTDCLARLDSCGAEPGLVALARRCLAFDPAHRPRTAEVVAQEVAALRAEAEQRARVAELEQARAAAETREQRKRRRVQLALAGALLLLLAVGGAFAW